MPELPEVETMVRGLQGLQGQKLEKLIIQDTKVWFESKLSAEKFSGSILRSITRKGKYLLFHFDQGIILQHLRMTGKMLPLDSPYIPAMVIKSKEKKKQIRAIFSFAHQKIAFYDTRRFGTLSAVIDVKKYWEKKKLAPDPIHEQEEALEYFLLKSKKKDKPIKSHLLDQTVLLGAGNIYVDEALHRAGLLPTKKVKKVSEEKLREIFQHLLDLFQLAIKFRGTTIINYRGADGEQGSFSENLLVYGREDELCKTCKKNRIQRKQVGGRSSFYCSYCQH